MDDQNLRICKLSPFCSAATVCRGVFVCVLTVFSLLRRQHELLYVFVSKQPCVCVLTLVFRSILTVVRCFIRSFRPLPLFDDLCPLRFSIFKCHNRNLLQHQGLIQRPAYQHQRKRKRKHKRKSSDSRPLSLLSTKRSLCSCCLATVCVAFVLLLIFLLDPVFDFVVESDGDDENPTGVLSLRFRPIMTQSTSSSPTSSSPPSPEQRHLHELHAITHALSAPGALTQFQTQFAAAIGPAISPSMASAQTHVTQTFLSAPQPRALAEPDFYSAVLGSQWLSDLSRALSPCLEDEAAKATSVSLSPSTSSSPAGEAKASSPASLSPSSLAVSPVSVASFSSASSGSSPAQESKQSPQLETKFQPLSPSSRGDLCRFSMWR